MRTPSDLRQVLPPLTMPMVLRKASRESLLSNQPAACIDDSPNPSVGIITARRAEPWVTLTSGCALLLFEELERGHAFVFVFGVTGCESTAYMRLLASHVFTFFLSFFSCDSLHSPTHRPCLTPPSSRLASTTTSRRTKPAATPPPDPGTHAQVREPRIDARGSVQGQGDRRSKPAQDGRLGRVERRPKAARRQDVAMGSGRGWRLRGSRTKRGLFGVHGAWFFFFRRHKVGVESCTIA